MLRANSEGSNFVGFCWMTIVIGKNKPGSVVDVFVYFTLCIQLLLLRVKNVAYSLKYTGQPALKVLTFKGITLFHSRRAKKLQNRE